MSLTTPLSTPCLAIPTLLAWMGKLRVKHIGVEIQVYKLHEPEPYCSSAINQPIIFHPERNF